jgi:hypothetical protein
MTQLRENSCSAKLQNTTKPVASDLVQIKRARKNGGSENTLKLTAQPRLDPIKTLDGFRLKFWTRTRPIILPKIEN